MSKVALFAFNGDFMCFIHVLLNALDLSARGYQTGIVIEGAATKLVPEMTVEGNPLYVLYQKAKSQGLIEGVCRACAAKMNVTEAVKAEGLAFLGDMSGHPSMSRYMSDGWQVISF